MGDFSTGALSNRAMSAFPISIGTALAMESIFKPMQPAYDPSRPLPPKIDINNYGTFWVNLMTLYRNIIGALDKDGANAVMAGDLSDTLAFEVDLIQRLVTEESGGRCECIFYASNYSGLKQAHPHGILREHKTERQRSYNSLMEITLGDFFKSQVKSDRFQHFDRLIQPKSFKRGLIMTHYAYDLLAYPEFIDLDLIESHTGVLKSRALWYTKLNNSKDLIRIPFNTMSIQIFGDSQTFSAHPLKVRMALLEVADKYNWNPLTTKDRLVFSIGMMKDVFTAAVLKQMLAE